MKHLVVLGAGGLLGRHILRNAPHAVGFDRAGCDITHRDDVARALERASAVINCAAFTNVDRAENETTAAFAANAAGAEHVGHLAMQLGIPAIHVSTDFVFDGEKRTPYDEKDAPNPLSAYGRSKHEGEVRLLVANPLGKIARVQGLYGVGGANFASKLADLLAAQKSLKLDDERKVQPTWAGSAAAQLLALVEFPHGGIFHVSCSGQATWAGFARRMIGKLGVKKTFDEVPSAALEAPAARPPNCLFAHHELQRVGLWQMPSWQDAQDAFLADR